MDLFERAAQADQSRAPLAERMRPRTLQEVLGQAELTGSGHLLARAVAADKIPSMIFWGPPGTGKTTLARVIAQGTGAEFVALSAVLAGVADIRKSIADANTRWAHHRKRTLLFVDEIHRFNKAQQDALLPHVENGTVTLIGATTENPSFEVNAALLSRARVLVLKALTDADLLALLERARTSEHGLAGKVSLHPEAAQAIAAASFGDARKALTALEVAADQVGSGGQITEAVAEEALQAKTLLYDKSGEEHFNVVSAFIKSMRGSDVDAAVYYLVRMLESGEEPRFVLRRMVIFASEDVGNADPRALAVALSALQAYELMGLPEATLPLTQAVTYLALCPKSNSALTAYAAARKLVREHGPLPVPLKLRNAPTRLMEGLGYGGGYRYPHEFSGHYVAEEYLPEKLQGARLVELSESGEEHAMRARLEALRAARKK
jgi:putative ATPase